MRTFVVPVLLIAASLWPVACRPAAPVSHAPCTPGIVAPWVRMAPAAMPMAAGYLVIENTCHHAITLTNATSSDFGSVTLHESRIENGVSTMRAVTGLTVAAGRRVQFAPGSYHLMLMQPARTLRAGDQVRVTFRLREGGTLTADLPVRDTAP